MNQLSQTDPRQVPRRWEALTRAVLDEWADLHVTAAPAVREKLAAARARLGVGQSKADAELPHVFALVCRGAQLALGLSMRVAQIEAGIALHRGCIVEMDNGSGKTLASAMPLVLRACAGQAVHAATANRYLVEKAVAELKPLYDLLAVSVGHMGDEPLSVQDAKAVYAQDLVYSTIDHLAFDYLRDNVAMDPSDCRQRALGYLLVDEVDWCLLDEGRTPCCLNLPGEDHWRTAVLQVAYRLTRTLAPGHDYDPSALALTPAGERRAQNRLAEAFESPEAQAEGLRCVRGCLQARRYKLDFDYLLRDGEVVYVDNSSGFAQPGRRFAWPLHSVLELEHGLLPHAPQPTLATTTKQNFAMLYGLGNLAGMTGTALSDSAEYETMYGLEVVRIEAGVVRREDLPDAVHKTMESKVRGVTLEVLRYHLTGRPVLVVAPDVAQSERLASRLSGPNLARLLQVQAALARLGALRGDFDPEARAAALSALRQDLDELPSSVSNRVDAEFDGVVSDPLEAWEADHLLGTEDVGALRTVLAQGIPAQVVNARRIGSYAEQEAALTEAGRLRAVTVATMMAGRGADILLGGVRAHELDAAEEAEAAGGPVPAQCREGLQVRSLGGLVVIGMERAELRRTDEHIRGRAGRCGAPGTSRFHVSLEDPLMLAFASHRMAFLTAGWPEEEAVESGFVTGNITRAQAKVARRNRETRVRLVEADAVQACHRRVFYAVRQEVLHAATVEALTHPIVRNQVRRLCDLHLLSTRYSPEWDVRGYLAALEEPFGLTSLSPTFVSHHDSRQTVEERSVRLCQSHLQAVGAEAATTVPQVRYLLLAAMDRAWMVYLEDMELAIEEAALRGWAFDDTFDGYWERGHELFAQLWERVEGAFLEGLMAAQTPGPAQAEADEDLGGNHSE